LVQKIFKTSHSDKQNSGTVFTFKWSSYNISCQSKYIHVYKDPIFTEDSGVAGIFVI